MSSSDRLVNWHLWLLVHKLYLNCAAVHDSCGLCAVGSDTILSSHLYWFPDDHVLERLRGVSGQRQDHRDRSDLHSASDDAADIQTLFLQARMTKLLTNYYNQLYIRMALPNHSALFKFNPAFGAPPNFN